ncbi:MAG: hypothetical protein RLN90_10400 [Balneolaceae bacterium]
MKKIGTARILGEGSRVTYDIDEVKSAHNIVSELIQKELKKFPSPDTIDFNLDDSEKANRVRNLLIALDEHRRSVIIRLVSILEIGIHDYCKALQFELELSLSYSDLKGNILEQFKDYTQKAINLNLPFDKENWKSIKEIFELRHLIVHHDGYLVGFNNKVFNRKKQILELAKKYNFLILEDEELAIDLSENTCDQVAEIAMEFCNIIYPAAIDHITSIVGDTSYEDDVEGPF